ncbi:MAG: hypothetical protein JWN84_2451 [Nocardioides sp.]|nr:hypothetical protein [Nocardioides sp.]
MTKAPRPPARRGRAPAPEVLRRTQPARDAGWFKGAPRALLVGVLVVVGARAGVVGALVGLLVAGVALFALHRSQKLVGVELDERGLVHRRLFGAQRWEWSEVGSVLLASRVTASASKPEVTWVVPRDHAGRRLFQVPSTAWSPEALTRLVERIGAHAEVVREPGPVRLGALARRHRGAFSHTQAHPALTAVLLTVLGVAVVVAGSYYGYEWLAPERRG